MSRRKRKPTPPKIWPYFNVDELTREEVLQHIQALYPRGSGPLGMMRIACNLLINIAELKGFEPFTEEELKANPDPDFYKNNNSAVRERG